MRNAQWVKLARAGELLAVEAAGGELRPLSKRTIGALITRGDLEAVGTSRDRKVSRRSIKTYLDGERGIWHANASSNRRPPGTGIIRPLAGGRAKASYSNGAGGYWTRNCASAEEAAVTPPCRAPAMLRRVLASHDGGHDAPSHVDAHDARRYDLLDTPLARDDHAHRIVSGERRCRPARGVPRGRARASTAGRALG